MSAMEATTEFINNSIIVNAAHIIPIALFMVVLNTALNKENIRLHVILFSF